MGLRCNADRHLTHQVAPERVGSTHESVSRDTSCRETHAGVRPAAGGMILLGNTAGVAGGESDGSVGTVPGKRVTDTSLPQLSGVQNGT